MSDEFEYRPMRRSKADGSEWELIATDRAAGRAYRTAAGARGVLSRTRREDNLRAQAASGYLTNPRFEPGDSRRPYWTTWALGYEYKVQRRPFGEWEDMP